MERDVVSTPVPTNDTRTNQKLSEIPKTAPRGKAIAIVQIAYMDVLLPLQSHCVLSSHLIRIL